MNVSVGVYGRFHAFNLAAQLQERGALAKLVTSYPAHLACDYGVERSKVSGLPVYEAVSRLDRRLAAKLGKKKILGNSIRSVFAESMARRIPENSDIVTVWSGVATPSFKKAEEIGAIKVLERGSTHPKFAQRILEEEYALQGIDGYRNPELDNDQSEYERADYIAIPSTFVKQTFVDEGVDPDRLIVAPYGVDLDEFPFEPVEHEPFRFIYVGAMSFRKGVHYLLEAFHQLKLKNAELWLVGGLYDEMKPYFAKYEGSFKYFGPQKQSDLHKFYNQCDAFCICSVEEGMAMVQLQAMACGLPLICTTNTGGADLIEKELHGLVFPIRSVEGISNALLSALEANSQIPEQKHLIRGYAERALSWGNYGESVLSHYRDLDS